MASVPNLMSAPLSLLAVLTREERLLVEVAYQLLEREQAHDQAQLQDYSFIVFPMARAYEGFLKRFLFDMRLISPSTYESTRFRIGRALNPDVRTKQRDEYWLFDDITRHCSPELADKLWHAWLTCRNRVFHFFPGEMKWLSLAEAQDRLVLLTEAMQTALSCVRHQGRS